LTKQIYSSEKQYLIYAPKPMLVTIKAKEMDVKCQLFAL